MELLSLLSPLITSLHRFEVCELRDEVERLRREHEAAVNSKRPTLESLVEENFELGLKLGLLVRLLIAKQVITAEEFAGLIAQSRPQVLEKITAKPRVETRTTP